MNGLFYGWFEDAPREAMMLREGPAAYTPGSKMPLQRMPNARERAELIAYLKRITRAVE